MARLLSPNDFGLFGIALLSMSCLETFAQTGFEQALIQKKKDIKEHLDTAWTTNLIRAFLLCFILFISAPAIGLFFNNPKAIILIRTIALAVFLKGLTNIRVIYFIKELKFNKQFIYRSIGIMAEFIVGVSLAIILRSAWALLFGLLANYFVTFLVSYIIYPYRPKLELNVEKFKELFSFGRWVFGSSVLVFLLTQGDDIFVGKLLGTVALGFYQMAYRISNMPTTEISHIISQVTFPAYSKLQDNIDKLREAYLKVLQFTAFLSFPIAGLIFILAPDFTRIFLGEKWLPMVPAMQVLVLWGLIRSIGATTGPIFYGVGRPKIITKLQLLQLFLLIILIYPLTMQFGILGAALSVVFAALIPNLIAFYITVKVTECGIYNFGKLIVLPLINTIVVILFVLILKIYWKTTFSILAFFVFILVAFSVYISVANLLDKFLNYKIWPILKNLNKVK
ncbi:MAG: lipopolysaccharide biosynthesis protein [Candidatus Omnitrophota bacterium]|nr:MAG: lipopolysaccharide biosynthesis protein [Candidatus Omnitrophota bacterium]